MFDNIFFMLLATKDKWNKDDIKSGKDLAMYYSYMELELACSGRKVNMSKSMYSLVNSDVKLVCDWLNKLKFPDGYICILEIVSSLSNVIGLKSHDCHVIIKGWQRLDTIENLVCSYWVVWYFQRNFRFNRHGRSYHAIGKRYSVILCKFEKKFPQCFFLFDGTSSYTFANETILCGPPQFRWMYPFEWFLRV